MKNVRSIAVLFTAAGLVGCGASETADTGTPLVISDISALPQATGPVATSTAAATASASLFKVAGKKGLESCRATTGTNLYTANSSTFTTGKSRGMCELTNYSKNVIDSAAQGDKVLCYVSNVMKATANAATLAAAGIDPYDGTSRIYTLDFGQGDASNPKIKMKIDKTSGSISRFEMFACFNGPNQTEYQLKTVGTDGSISMINKNVGSSGGSSWSGMTSVTGALSSDLKFVSKAIQSSQSYTSSGWTGTSKIDLTQYSDRMVFSGFQTGTGSYGGHASSNTTRIYAEYELLDSNVAGEAYSLHNLAMGDGNLKAVMTNSWNGQNYSNSTEDAWNGDTRVDHSAATSGPYYTAVTAAEVPTVESVSIAFDTDQTWDCSGTSELTLAVDQAALDTACSDFGLRADGEDSWIDCWNATGE